MRLFKILLPGLLIAQLIATVEVYLSNAALYRSVTAIIDAGYLAVPNRHAMLHLREFGPAVFGGIFFTLTVGAGLSLLAFTAAWMWDRVFYRGRVSLGVFLLLWVGCLVSLNLKGFCPGTAYFLFVPPVVFAAAFKWMPPRTPEETRRSELFHSIPLLLLAFMWIPLAGGSLFIDIRDSFLLSGPPGKWINDFYYNYTLYPAEVFKSFDQKMIRTCNSDQLGASREANLVKRKLLRYDYLSINGYAKADLEILKEEDVFIFKNRGKETLRVLPEEFLNRPGSTLKEFSRNTDRYFFFRKCVLFCLLTGSPVILYVFLNAFFLLLLNPFIQSRRVSAIAALLCLLTGGALLVILHSDSEMVVNRRTVSEAMKSEHWQDRVAALKFIGEKGMEVDAFEEYKSMLKSSLVPERYWLAQAMSKSRKAEISGDLRSLLDDPHRNVVCMALYAIGRRGDRAEAAELIKRIKTSDDWYTQWYAYRALRSVGWKQTESK